MRASRSEFVTVRGLRYHLRCWGPDTGRAVFILHGWADVSATWQFVVDALPDDWRIISPDWRGFGLSDWRGDTYWFADYVADLDAILRARCADDEQIDIVAHSMGSQVGALYAGVRPGRVRRLVCLDGFFVPEMPAKMAPERLAGWLDKLAEEPPARSYPSYDDLAARVARHHPGLSAERAAFVARAWGGEGEDGRIHLRTDPRHREHGPLLFRPDEALEVFKRVEAPVLNIDAGQTGLGKWLPEGERDRRLACFKRLQRHTIDAGHMLHFDAPEETAAAITAFLAADAPA